MQKVESLGKGEEADDMQSTEGSWYYLNTFQWSSCQYKYGALVIERETLNFLNCILNSNCSFKKNSLMWEMQADMNKTHIWPGSMQGTVSNAIVDSYN